MAIFSNLDDLVDKRPTLDALPPSPCESGIEKKRGLLSDEHTQPPSIDTTDMHVENRHDQTHTSTQVVSEPPSSQLNKDGQDSRLCVGKNAIAISCPEYSNAILPGTSLQPHVTNTNPCDQSPPVMPPKEIKEESKTCHKCGKVFASNQGLRGHLSRVTPCDQEKTVSNTTRRRPASRMCPKCNKTFASLQSLRMHRTRVNPCNQDHDNVSESTTLQNTTKLAALAPVSTEELRKENERKARSRYQTRKSYLKKRGHLDELGILRLPGDSNGIKETERVSDLKMKVPDISPFGGTESEQSRCGDAKRPHLQEKIVREDKSAEICADVSESTPQSPLTTSQSAKVVLSTEGSFVHRSNKCHGGDLLAGGCSCPTCVRRWARKLMNKMQQLEDEVLTLRQTKHDAAESAQSSGLTTPRLHENPETATGQSARTLLSAAKDGNVPHGNFGVARTLQTRPANVFEPLIASSQSLDRPVRGSIDGTTLYTMSEPDVRLPHLEGNKGGPHCIDGDRQLVLSVLRAVGSDKNSLMDAYEHMNDQILLNERTVEESSNHVQVLVGYNRETAMDFRRQVAELCASIHTEKIKRDVTVAALIAHVWKPRRDEFREFLSTQFWDSIRDEQAYHTKLAQITSQVSMKNKIISELERRMEALGEPGGGGRSRYAEMGELSSKMAAEYAAKMTLESERESYYVGLVKSSTRIRSLVRSALLWQK